MQAHPKLVERFHRVLVEEILQAVPDYLQRPFTVAEIYQSLVPYRTHRDRLGVEMNGDYEDVLLRLLAGEGDLLILDSEPARRRIRKELEHPNPNTGIYREFAAVEVRLNPSALPDDVAPPEGVEAESTSQGGGGRAGKPPAGNGLSGLGASRVQETPSEPPRTSSGRRTTPDECPECDARLPDRDTLRFCPACGADVLVTPCGSCGESLDRSWRYCVACGTPTGT